MSTTRGPWRVSLRQQSDNGRIGIIHNEEDVDSRVKLGYRASAMGGEYAE
jgi:hypothetical protein